MSFRDRFYTPVVARAMTSPLAIVLAGAGASAGIVAGSGGVPSVIGGVLGAVAAWGLRVGLAISRGESSDRVDTSGLDEPWRHLTEDALAARRQFYETVGRTKPGPMRDRLDSLGRRIDASTTEIREVARAGHELSIAARRIDVEVAQRDIERVTAKQSVSELSATTQATVRSLEAQIATAARLRTTIVQTNDRLELLNARLDEAVAGGIELSVGSFRPDEFTSVEQMVDSIADELEAVRSALDDTATTSGRDASARSAPQHEQRPQGA